MIHAVWLIPALPLAGFLILLATGRRLGDPKAGYLATAMISGSFLVAVGVFFDLMGMSGEERHFEQDLFSWIGAGALDVHVGFLVDPLSVTMALFVTGVGALIHLYSVGYMHGDERYPRFFVYLNLFAFSMLMLVLGDSLLLTFLGWEGVGACSYLLISFWFERETAAVAGKKAFVTNRVGDFGFMLAMFLVFQATGSLTYETVFGRLDGMAEGTAAAVALLLLLGAAGKSAQLPLYVWLPDAMEGPTPVSALIHAATMVTAGVFLLVRMNPLFDVGPEWVLTVVAIVGAATALFAATIACAQDDIKRVLAYSTISQLGFMFLAVGSGAYVAAVFHMVTHAFFKALLFLGAGSVIHGLHDEQDMKHMGALRRFMPLTAVTFIVGWLAIAGVPPFAGFWSKDEILIAAWDKSPVLWAVGGLAALLTAYYMTRQVVLVFFGRSRWDEAHVHPHESPWTMGLPLAVLAVLSVVGGALNIPLKGWLRLDEWLHPVIGAHHQAAVTTGTKWALATTVLVTSLLGLLTARALWLRRADRPGLEPVALRRAWGVDALVSFLFGSGGRLVA